MAITSSHFATLDGTALPIHPSGVSWTFQAKTKQAHTIGGKVIQVYGMTIGDITLTGSVGGALGVNPEFGRAGESRDERTKAYQMAGVQAKSPEIPNPREGELHTLPRAAYRAEQAVKEFKAIAERHVNDAALTPMDLVLPGLGFGGRPIKVWLVSMSMTDADGYSISHSPGKMEYQFTIVLRYAAGDISEVVASTISDSILNLLAEGVGYERNAFNGTMHFDRVKEFAETNNLGILDILVESRMEGLSSYLVETGSQAGPPPAEEAPQSQARPGGAQE